MIHLITSLVFAMALMVQTTLFKMYGPVAPDTALLAALYCGVRYMKLRGYQIGVAVGLAQDLLSHGIMGLNLLSKGLIGFTSGSLRENHVINPQSPTTWGMVIFLATCMNEAVMWLYATGFFATPLDTVAIARVVVVQTAMNLAFGIPFFYFLNRLQEQLRDILGIREF